MCPRNCIVNTYDGFGEVTSTAISMGGFTKTLRSSYDAAGERIQLIHPENTSAYTFTYAYDALGRLSDVCQGTAACTGTSSTSVDGFTYANNGLVSGRSEGSGSAVSYGWDDVGRLTSQSDSFSNSVNNVGWTLAYNPASQIVTDTRDNNNYAWTGAVNVNDNYGVNGLNQYTSAGPASFTPDQVRGRLYDVNGNLTGDGSWTYVYDVENRLVKATDSGTGDVTTFTYDPLGRLWQMVRVNSSGSTLNNARYLHDGDAIVDIYNSAGSVAARFVHGSNAAADDPLVWYVGAGLTSKRWLHADHLGSIVAATSATTLGGSPSINTYDEYGIPGSSNVGWFQYTGQLWLAPVGLYYYKARIYSATLGRFLQTDPVGYEGGMNLYGYAMDDPVDREDFDGKCPECVGFIVGVGLEAFNQYISTGRVDLSRGGLAKLTIAGVVGASGVGIGGQIAKVSASFAARAALNAAAGAALGAGQTAANARVEGQRVSGAEVVKGAALGGAAGAAGSVAADAVRGGARVLAEHTGVNIVTRAGQVATPTASSTRDAVIRKAADVAGNAAQALPSAADAARQRLNCPDPTRCR